MLVENYFVCSMLTRQFVEIQFGLFRYLCLVYLDFVMFLRKGLQVVRNPVANSIHLTWRVRLGLVMVRTLVEKSYGC